MASTSVRPEISATAYALVAGVIRECRREDQHQRINQPEADGGADFGWIAQFQFRQFALAAQAAPGQSDDAEADEQAAAEYWQQRWQHPGLDNRRNNRQANRNDEIGNQDDDQRQRGKQGFGARMARKNQRRRGARCQPAEHAEQRRAVLLAKIAQRRVAAEADAGNKDHHPPDLRGVERRIRPEIAIRQDRQDDQREHAELQDRNEVAAGKVF